MMIHDMMMIHVSYLSLPSNADSPLSSLPSSFLFPFPPSESDWAISQVCHSANYGGYYAGLATGGLNLQIEHHLFPPLAYHHYPSVAVIVRQECAKRGVPYVSFDALPKMMGHFLRFMRNVGNAH